MGRKIVVILIGILFAGVGLFLLRSNSQKMKRCTVEVPGKVVNIVEEREYEEGSYHYTYFPVISYQAEGQTIESQYTTGFGNKNKFVVGQSITILYNPNQVSEYVIQGEKSNSIMGIAFLVGGILVFAIGVLKRQWNSY